MAAMTAGARCGGKLTDMSTITFDTLKFSNRLKAADLKDLATKADLLVTKEDLQKEMLLLEQRLVIKLGTLMAVAIGVIAALVKLL